MSDEIGFQEPNITINGQVLTPAQAMTIRVAMSGFQSQMSQEDALGDDNHGKQMAQLYQDRSSEVISLLMQ